MPSRPLILPARQLDGVTGSGTLQVFVTSAKTWTGLVPRASDYQTMPIAWTSYQQALYDGQTEEDFKAGNVYVNPTNWFAAQHTPVRLPKIVMHDFSSLNTNITTFRNNIFSSISSDLLAKKVMVSEDEMWRTYGFADEFPFTMVLPHEATTEITDNPPSPPFAGPYITDQRVVTPANWIGGEVLYLIATTLNFNNQGPWGIFDSSFPTSAYFELSNHMQQQIETVKSCYSRYDRVRYHICFAVPNVGEGGFESSHPGPDYGVSRPLFINTFVSAMLQTADYGVTYSLFDGGIGSTKTALENSFRNAVIDFFDL